jgi:hypothetical protein
MHWDGSTGCRSGVVESYLQVALMVAPLDCRVHQLFAPEVSVLTSEHAHFADTCTHHTHKLPQYLSLAAPFLGDIAR